MLLAMVGVVIGALRSRSPRVPEQAALVVRPSGDDRRAAQRRADRARAQRGARPERMPQTLLWDLTDAIRAAAKDARIRVAGDRTDEMDGVGQASRRRSWRGDPRISSQRQEGHRPRQYYPARRYYLAAQADEVYLDPFGFVLLDGYSRYRMYFKDAAGQAVNVDMHMFRVGKYKSAVEDYTRSEHVAGGPRGERGLLKALWRGYQRGGGRARASCRRARSANYVSTYAAGRPRRKGDGAQVAKKARLVTGIKARDGGRAPHRRDRRRGSRTASLPAGHRGGLCARACTRTKVGPARPDPGGA